MDIVVIIFILGMIAILIFKKPIYVIYYIAMVDILFRVLAFLAANLPIKVTYSFINKYFPISLNSMISIYSSGIFTTVLNWLLIIVYVIFEYYLIKMFLKKK